MVSKPMVKSHEKEISNLFSCDYHTTYYSIVNCRQNVNFEEIDTELSTGQIDKYWLLWGIFN